MKLELKHIAPYLPYGLMIYRKGDWDGENTGRITDCGTTSITTEDADHCFDYESAKPILRPLSDLTKEIVYKKEKFVPIEELGDHFPHLQPYNDDHSPQLFYEWIKEKIEYANGIDRGDIPYSIMEKLFEWHFDVFGLIDARLAIEKK